MIGPSLEEISDELAGKVVIAKLNIDDHPDAPAKYGVRGIPTMILFKNGAIAETKVGAAPKSALKGRSEEHTSELQSLMRISYAVFCLKKKNKQIHTPHNILITN